MQNKAEHFSFNDINQELEIDIIASCLFDPKFFITIGHVVTSSHFRDKRYSKVYKLIQAFFEKYHKVPNIKTAMQLISQAAPEIDTQKLTEEIGAVSHDNTDWLRDEIVHQARNQELRYFIANTAINEIDNPNPDIDNLVEDLKKILTIDSTFNIGLDFFNVEERYAKILAFDSATMPTGYQTLDIVLQGGWRPKEMYVFMAPPGVGKSLHLTWVGQSLLMLGKNVVHFTMENPEERVSIRYDSAILKEEGMSLVRNHQQTIERLNHIKETIKGRLLIKEYSSQTASTNTIRSYLTMIYEYEGFKPDAVIVDYIDIMKSDKKYDDDYAEQGAISRELRSLGQELDVPIITATQTKRGALEKDIITMDDIADSYHKARVADAIFAILEKDIERELGIQRLYIVKNRNAAAHQLIRCKVSKETMNIVDCGFETGQIVESTIKMKGDKRK